MSETERNLTLRCGINTINTVNGEIIIEDKQEKVNIFGAYYESINTPRHLNRNTRLREIIDAKTTQFKTEYDASYAAETIITNFDPDNRAYGPSSEVEGVKYFTCIDEITKIIKKLPNKTSSGVDGVPAIVLKHLTEQIIRDYTIIFNNCLNLNYSPNAWKISKIFPILKKGKPSNHPSSYRPISLAPNISKVFESVINNSIVNFCNENSIIPQNQFGFKHQYSTTHAINKLLSDVNLHLHNKLIVGATLIDLEKAFDSVWLEGLIYILIKKNFPISLIKTISSLLKDRKFTTWDGKNLSSITFKILEGLNM